MRIIKVLCAAAVAAVVVAPNAAAFRFSDHTRLMPIGVVGQPFSHPVETVAGCKGVYVTVGPGSLPPGLRLVGDKRDLVDGSNWRIVGTPTTPGRFPFWLVAKNLCPADSTEEDLAIQVLPSGVAPLALETTTLPAAMIGAPYAARLEARGDGAKRWSIEAGALPAGLRLLPDGSITGRATPAARSTSVEIAVTGIYGQRVARTVTVEVRSGLAVATRALPALRVGRPYALRLAAVGGAGRLQWELAGGRLPAGLRLYRYAGRLVGRPTRAGRYTIVVRVLDGLGSVATRRFVLIVRR